MSDLISTFAAGEKSHVDFCECLNWKPNLWLSDKRKHDFTSQELWINMPTKWKIHQSCEYFEGNKNRSTLLYFPLPFSVLQKHVFSLWKGSWKKKQLLCHWSFQSLNYHAYIPPLLITIQFRSLLDSAHITAKHWSPKVVLNHISKTQFCPHWLPYKEFPYPQKTKLFSFLVKGPNQPLGYIKKKLSTFSVSPLL